MVRVRISPNRESLETKLLLQEQRSDAEDETEYDDALQECGYGRFHYILLFVCGWANASDAIEILCISFLLPSAECDLDLTSERKGWLSAILFIGMMIGGYVWGSLGDSIGRRGVLINAMLLNALAGIGSSFSQEFYLFLTLRFISGVGVGGSIPVVWTYFAEFQPSHKRGGALSGLASFWMIGNIVVAGMAWLVIPHHLGWEGGDGFQFNSWRIFVVLSAIPSLLVAISLLFLPESPKFLLSKGNPRAALQILKQMYSQNTGHQESTFPVTQLVSDEMCAPVKMNSRSRMDIVKETISNTAKLFTSKELFRVTSLMIIINFAIQFGYYGLWLWFPELFNKLNIYYTAHPEESIGVCEVIGKDLSGISANTTEVLCENRDPPDNQVFINSFIISLSSGPSNLWTILYMDKLGRKFFLCLSMVLSGASAFLIYLVNSTTMNLVLSCIFGAVSTMGFNSLDCLGIELFPTSLRGTAMAITLVSARVGAILGNLVFGYLVETYCAIPIILVAVLLVGGGVLSILLPNTTKKPLL